MLIQKLYVYDNKQEQIEFRRGGPGDWYVWHVRWRRRPLTDEAARKAALSEKHQLRPIKAASPTERP